MFHVTIDPCFCHTNMVTGVFYDQYPLKEVVVIHQEQTYLDDVVSLESYIKEVSASASTCITRE